MEGNSAPQDNFLERDDPFPLSDVYGFFDEPQLETPQTDLLKEFCPYSKELFRSQQIEALVSNTFLLNERGVDYWERKYKDIVVVPSLTLNCEELSKIDGICFYEERQLFNLILLRHQDTRIIFITSLPLDISIVEYYWKLLPGEVPFADIQKRLLLLSTCDSSPKALTLKILERPRLIERIRKFIRNPKETCLTCFSSSVYEIGLANLLGIPLLAVNAPHLWWGTKAGSRQIFHEVGVPFPEGTNYNIHDIAQLAEQIAKIYNEDPVNHLKFVVKLNEGFSGKGNAIFDLTEILPCKSHEDLVRSIESHLKNLKFQADTENWNSFAKKIAEIGCIVEIFIENSVSSPSFQACVDVSGKIIFLSTHEQVLGGLNHQVYQGCSFPANDSYRMQIQEYGKQIGKKLAEKGVIDHFGVDFLVVPTEEKATYLIYAIEINLRQGGTTHPMMTLKLLTGGKYDEISGTFKTLKGHERYYLSSDNVVDPLLKGFLPYDIMENFINSELHFNHETEKGVVFHLLGCLSQYGKLGITAIGDSPIEASDFYNRAIQNLKEMANETNEQRIKILQSIQNPRIVEPTH